MEIARILVGISLIVVGIYSLFVPIVRRKLREWGKLLMDKVSVGSREEEEHVYPRWSRPAEEIAAEEGGEEATALSPVAQEETPSEETPVEETKQNGYGRWRTITIVIGFVLLVISTLFAVLAYYRLPQVVQGLSVESLIWGIGSLIGTIVAAYAFYRYVRAAVIVVPTNYVYLLETRGRYIATLKTGIGIRPPLISDIVHVSLQEVPLSLFADADSIEFVDGAMKVSARATVQITDPYAAHYNIGYDVETGKSGIEAIRPLITRLLEAFMRVNLQGMTIDQGFQFKGSDIEDLLDKKEQEGKEGPYLQNLDRWGVEMRSLIVTSITPPPSVVAAREVAYLADQKQKAKVIEGTAEGKGLVAAVGELAKTLAGITKPEDEFTDEDLQRLTEKIPYAFRLLHLSRGIEALKEADKVILTRTGDTVVEQIVGEMIAEEVKS